MKHLVLAAAVAVASALALAPSVSDAAEEADVVPVASPWSPSA